MPRVEEAQHARGGNLAEHQAQVQQFDREKNDPELQKMRPEHRFALVRDPEQKEGPQIPDGNGQPPEEINSVQEGTRIPAKDKQRKKKVDCRGGKRDQLGKFHSSARYARRIKQEFLPPNPELTFIATLTG